jgi:hypothetical protein
MEKRRAKVMHLQNSVEHPLSEQRIVEATVAFANGAVLEIDGLVAKRGDPDSLVGDKQIEERLKMQRAFRERGIGEMPSDIPADAGEYRAQMRTATRARLSDIVADPVAAAREYVGRSFEDVISAKTVLRATPAGLVRASYYTFSTESDLVLLGSVLLAADERFRDKLCQCQLASCAAFFFEKRPPTGRPQRRYCTRAHMLRAHDENASHRMAKKRPPAKSK